mgnify:FL=1
MNQWSFTASRIFNGANRFIEAYHAALQPLCRQTGLPPMAVDILMFIANNPENGTAGDICRCRGLKAGIVSVHIDRLVNEGLLVRQSVPGDRRKTRLVCTPAAEGILEAGRTLQKCFAQKLLAGIEEADMNVFLHCLTVLGRNVEEIRKSGVSTEERR